MAIGDYGEIPFGVRDAAIFPLTGDTPGTGIDIPRIRQVEMNVTRDSAELEGDDVTVAVQSFAKTMEGSIEAGGISLAAIAVLEGGTVGAEAGSGTDHSVTYAVRGDDVDGYFQLIAQSIANDGGDVHLVVYKVKATSGPNYNFENGNFFLTQCDLQAVFNGEDPSKLYDLIQHETATTIDLTP